MVGRRLGVLGPVRLALLFDAAFEVICAIALAIGAWSLADLFNVDTVVPWALSAVFLAAAAGVAGIAFSVSESRELVWALAAGNVMGGVALWALFAALQGDFDPGARWVIGAIADSFILVGLLEIVAIKRTPARAD